jgi:hypothetical protein
VTVRWHPKLICVIDCFQSLCYDRLGDVFDSRCEGIDGARSLEDGFAHFACPSLPHFIAMLCPPPPAQPACIPPHTTLLVIDSLSALVNAALPRTVEGKGPPIMANGKKGRYTPIPTGNLLTMAARRSLHTGEDMKLTPVTYSP